MAKFIAEHSAKAQSVRQGVKGERELVSAIVGSGERWLIWICHRAAIERFEPHRCTRQRQTVLRSTRSTTSIEKTSTMDSNGFFNVHRSRAIGQSTETLVDCVNEGAGYNNSLRQRRTLLTSASQASGSIQSTRRKVCFAIKMNWLSNVVCLQVPG